MARGHPDFYSGIIPSQPVYGAGQTVWTEVEEGDIPGSSYDDYINYEVPSGKELHITTGFICCDFPCLQRCALNWSPALLGTITYDTNLNVPLHPSATYVISAGNTIYVRVYNDDGAEHHFVVNLIGFLVDVAE